ncbi:MAG: hypothetical protein ABW189_04745 [Rickettsiales bacterium]
MDYIRLISAARIGGIVGSLLTTLVQAWLSNKQRLDDRNFQEKKEAYVGYLDAAHNSEVQRTLESVQKWGYWENRCELVGSLAVIKLAHEIRETNPVDGMMHPNRPDVIRKLKQAMRKDLGVHIS